MLKQQNNMSAWLSAKHNRAQTRRANLIAGTIIFITWLFILYQVVNK